jgi:hypothetical protein
MKKVYRTSFVSQDVMYKTSSKEYFLKVNLYREWVIWSKCFGKVLVINGTSSSGKTTLCKYLSKFGFNKINSDEILDEVMLDFFSRFTKNVLLVKSFLVNDDITRVLNGYKVKEVNYSKSQLMLIKILQDEINHILKHHFPHKMEIYDKIYEKAAKYVFSGQDVVIDIVAKGDSIDMLSYCFRYYPIKTVLLYCSLQENLIKCIKRNYTSLSTDGIDYRYPAVIIDQYDSFYTFILKNNISKKDKVIGIVNKDQVRAILEIAKSFDYNLFLSVQEKLYSE